MYKYKSNGNYKVKKGAFNRMFSRFAWMENIFFSVKSASNILVFVLMEKVNSIKGHKILVLYLSLFSI